MCSGVEELKVTQLATTDLLGTSQFVRSNHDLLLWLQTNGAFIEQEILNIADGLEKLGDNLDLSRWWFHEPKQP